MVNSGPNQQNIQPGMIGQPVQRAPFENQLQVERQQNLEKINKLKQTLEAAQQQEQQYKTQLERISHLKMSPLQEALQAAQQAEMQYKMIEVNIVLFIFFNLYCCIVILSASND